METHVVTFRIGTSFEEWSVTYDASVPMMHDAGITSLYRGVSKEDPGLVCAVMQAAPGALEGFMAANADLITKSGHILESTVDQVFVAGS